MADNNKNILIYLFFWPFILLGHLIKAIISPISPENNNFSLRSDEPDKKSNDFDINKNLEFTKNSTNFSAHNVKEHTEKSNDTIINNNEEYFLHYSRLPEKKSSDAVHKVLNSGKWKTRTNNDSFITHLLQIPSKS